MLRESLFYACAALVLAAGFVGSAAGEKKAPAAATTEPLIKGTPRHTVIAADGSRGKVFKISPEGKIVWEFKAVRRHDAWLLDNGNVLATRRGGVIEISPDKKIAWQYTNKKDTGGVMGVHITDAARPRVR